MAVRVVGDNRSLGNPLLPLSSGRRIRSCSSREVVSFRRRSFGCRCNVDAFDFEPVQREKPAGKTLFPGGFRRPKIKVPTIILKVDAADVLRSADAIDLAVSKGFIGIVLLLGGDDNGGKLYEAACVLKSVIRERAYFLISERVDIASAVGASGVVLSDQGLPVIVAKNMMMSSRTESVLLPLVGRTLQKAAGAMTASVSEGADLLIFRVDRKSVEKVLVDCISTQNIKVPIFLDIVDWSGEGPPFEVVLSNLLQLGGSGFIVALDDMSMLKEDAFTMFSNSQGANVKIQDESLMLHRHEDTQALVGGFSKLEEQEIKLIEAERTLLLEAIEIIREAAPLMDEVSLLEDALSRLDEPFMMVIVGEFNSGKSTIINALLGRRYLREGVIPTTNEITLLRYSETEKMEKCEFNPDGQFICFLPAPILKEMNLVDTPGTNVILQRQQRLTEEFVPRADLVVFALSSDRPLTESEVSFLRYIQQWKKKVLFVLNKADLYQNNRELEEGISFVRENARRFLNQESVLIYPVSARSALEAKLSSSSEVLLSDVRWLTSGFPELEDFLYSFLDGSTDTGMERMKLKLETPIGIADRLLTACEAQVKYEFECAKKDLSSINDLIGSVNSYALKMEKESSSWIKRTISLVGKAKARAVNMVESTLRLSNIDLITTYALKGEKSGPISSSTSVIQNEIINPALVETRMLMGEYLLWLRSSMDREGQIYLDSFEKRWSVSTPDNQQLRPETLDSIKIKKELSMKVTEDFSSSAAAKLLEQEIREVVLGTFGALGAAGLSASLLTSVLPTTAEDLLALTFCASGGLLAISNFPARRKEAVEKVKRIADSLAREIEQAMQKDLALALQNLKGFVEYVGRPYQEAAQLRIERLSRIQQKLEDVEKKLQLLKVQVQNLTVS
ncbi:FZO-like protein [Wolffia australiana]